MHYIRGMLFCFGLLATFDAQASPALCSLEVDGKLYLNQPCNAEFESDGGFSIGINQAPINYFAIVNAAGNNSAEGFWNGTARDSHAHEPLGILNKSGDCWANNRARVCAKSLSFYFVTNTEPPDAYLSLRTEPTTKSGSRITTMPNGTLLDVLDRKSDGWWFVRVIHSDQLGWTLSTNGKKTWIDCCRAKVASTEPANVFLSGNAKTETPQAGTPNRTAIMDAIRKPLGVDTKFMVRFLKTVKSPNGELAFVSVDSANRNLEVGGLFLIERQGKNWLPLYTLGGGGGVDDCGKAKIIVKLIIAKATSYNAPHAFLSDEFWKEAESILQSEDKDMCTSSRMFQ